MKPRLSLERLLITDRRLYGPQFIEGVLAATERHGATAIQLRERDLPEEELLRLATELVARSPVPVLLNHREDLVDVTGAAGVHLGFASVTPEEARRRLPKTAWIGLSVHSEAEALAAAPFVDYLVFGPVCFTPSKEGVFEPRGFDVLHEVCARCPRPIVAIGGLSPQDEARVRASGAAGFAAIRAFAPSPEDR